MAVIGSVEVEVVPDARKFVPAMRSQILPAADKLGRDFGERFGAAGGPEARKGLELALKDIKAKVTVDSAAVKKTGNRAGQDLAGEFDRVVRTRVSAALSSLPHAEINADSSPAELAIAGIREQLKAIHANVGVDLNDKEALAGIEVLRRRLLALSRESPDIRVSVDAGAAALELAALQAGLVVTQGAVAAASADAESGLEALGTAASSTGALVTKLGTAGGAAISLIGPTAGAATAGVIGLSAAAGTALLAFKGIQTQLEQGTPAAVALQTQITGLGGTFANLERVAADSALPGITDGLKKINGFLPSTAGLVTGLASNLGVAADHLSGAFVAGLKTSTPLIQHFGQFIEQGADGLERFAESNQFKQFIAYADQELPKIANLLGQTAVAAKNVVVALQPIGDELIKDTSQALEFFNQLNDGASKFNKNSGGLLDKLGSFAFTNPFGSSKATGAKVSDVVSPNLGLGSIATATSPESVAFAAQAKILGTTVPTLQAATNANEKYANGVASAAVILRIQNKLLLDSNPALAAQAKALGVLPVTLQTAQAAQQANATATAQATLNMRLQSDAAGLLAQALSGIGGNNLGVAQAQTANATAINTATKSLKDNGLAIDGTTEKALANQGALQGAASSAIALADAVAKQTGSTLKSNKSLSDSKAALLAQLKAQGQLTPAIQAYVDTLFKIKPRYATQIDADTAAATKAISDFVKANDGRSLGITVDAFTKGAYGSIQDLLDFIGRQTPTVYVKTVQAPGAPAIGGRAYATGGKVLGRGTGTSDSIPARLSNGEFVVNAKQTAKHANLLRAINSGVQGFASGGQAKSVGNAPSQVTFTLGVTDTKSLVANATKQLTAAAVPAAVSAAPARVNAGGMPSTVVLRVGDREFTAYVDERASGVTRAATATSTNSRIYSNL